MIPNVCILKPNCRENVFDGKTAVHPRVEVVFFGKLAEVEQRPVISHHRVKPFGERAILLPVLNQLSAHVVQCRPLKGRPHENRSIAADDFLK